MTVLFLKPIKRENLYDPKTYKSRPNAEKAQHFIRNNEYLILNTEFLSDKTTLLETPPVNLCSLDTLLESPTSHFQTLDTLGALTSL